MKMGRHDSYKQHKPEKVNCNKSNFENLRKKHAWIIRPREIWVYIIKNKYSNSCYYIYKM